MTSKINLRILLSERNITVKKKQKQKQKTNKRTKTKQKHCLEKKELNQR